MVYYIVEECNEDYIWNAISHPILKLDEHNLVTSIFLSRKI